MDNNNAVSHAELIAGQNARKSKQLAIIKILNLRENVEEQLTKQELGSGKDNSYDRSFTFKINLTAPKLRKYAKRKTHLCTVCKRLFSAAYTLSLHKKSVHQGI